MPKGMTLISSTYELNLIIYDSKLFHLLLVFNRI